MAISFSSRPNRNQKQRGAGVTAVLGPTNTGKTHLAIERMLAHSSGMIGLPLRLLAREVYNKVVDRVGADAVALITGEEKIKPPHARYWVSTVEAMPRDLDVSFLAVDEIQLGADFERGHVFTDRMLNLRARDETLILGAATMRPMVEKLLPGANIVSRPRLSTAGLFRREEDHPAAVALGHRRVLGGRGLRHRRTDPPPARRRRRGSRRAVAAHAQRAGRALSERRRGLSGRDRRHRHGSQSRCRPCRICLRPQIRRLSIPQAQPGRTRPDRRPRRPRHARRHFRHHRPLRSVRARTGAGAGKSHVSSRSGCCNGATAISISPRSAPCRRRCR